MGTDEVLNVRGTGRIHGSEVNRCPDRGSESRGATEGEKLQIGLWKADKV